MIAYFVHNLNGYSGAAGQALLLAKHINREIIFFNFGHGNSVVDDELDFRVFDMPKNVFFQLLYLLYFTIFLRIKIFHFHGLFASGLLVGSILGRKMILKTTLQGDDDFDTLRKKPLWHLRFFFLSKVDFNVVLSNALYRINVKYISPEKIIKIPNGVVVCEPNFSLQDKENRFCYVGLVCERKSTFKSIEYFIRNYSSVEDSKFYVVGPYENVENNIELDDFYVSKCIDFVKNSECCDKVIFTGSVSKSEVANILSKSKALLFFSKNEGMPNVVLEAMSVNCVPIIGDIGGVGHEMVNNGIDGFVVDSEEDCIPIDCVEKIIQKNSPFISALEKYDIRVVANKYNKLYAALKCF